METVVTQRGLQGLTDSQVQERVARGEVNDVPRGPSRTFKDIFLANLVTRFNILLTAVLGVVIFVAPIQDALFGVVLVVNTAIGIIQELRAKATLDRLALLSAPKARVLRSGRVKDVGVDQVVLDDVLELRPGDQVVVDGQVLTSDGLEVNESLLTGESEPVLKRPGDECLSGSFVDAGIGRYVATKVGRDAYAVQLAEEARKFTLVKSELRGGIDTILAIVSWLIIPTVILLVWSQLNASNTVAEGLRASVAGVVGMVPQGLVLLTSMAFAVGVIRLGRRKTLVQELPAIEVLARVDVVCFDKTGTLTEGSLEVEELVTLDPEVDPVPAIGAFAAADPTPNATLAAVAAAYPKPEGWRTTKLVPFSSARRWSGASFAEGANWVVGAPGVVPLPPLVAAHAEELAQQGRRVLAVASTNEPLEGDRLPSGLSPKALIVLGDRIRADAAETLAYFADQGVETKVISGDHPATVGAIAQRVDMPGADRVVDGRELPEDPERFADAVEAGSVFGRVTPHQKREMVAALQRRGHTVAMTGDGVNDVLALKDSDIGIAMGSGSPASRAVAQLVLIDGAFTSLPSVVGEGRRVIANIELVANLFVTKTVYAFLLAIAVGVLARPFPFVPRHLTLVGTVTIGIPAFFLALAASRRRARSGFVKRVLRFAIPVGALAALATGAAYELVTNEGIPLIERRTTATMVLAAIGMFALIIVTRPMTTANKWLVGSMFGILFIVFASPAFKSFFELQLPSQVIVLAAIGIIAITGGVMYGSLRAVGWLQHVPEILTAETARERWERFTRKTTELTNRALRRGDDSGAG